MFLAENLKITLSASIAFDRSNAKCAKPKSIITTERAHTQGANLMCMLFFLPVKFLLSQK